MWVETAQEIIRRAMVEHDEGMKSLEVLRKEREAKHTGVRRTSKPQIQHTILST